LQAKPFAPCEVVLLVHVTGPVLLPIAEQPAETIARQRMARASHISL
jgi:hypothetical protein